MRLSRERHRSGFVPFASWVAAKLEMARLDALQVALWDKAIAGDLDACPEVRAIIIARVRLLGLVEQAKRPATWSAHPSK